MIRKLFLTILLIFAFAVPGWAETLYVRPVAGEYGDEDGSDYDNAFDGIADIAQGAGVGSLEAGDELYICGSHDEKFTLTESGSSGNRIVLRGDYPGDAGTIDSTATDYSIDLSNQTYITILNLGLAGGTTATLKVSDSDNLTIQDCTFGDPENGVMILRVPDGNDTHTVVITRNTFEGWNCGCGVLVHGDNWLITENTFQNAAGGQAIALSDVDDNHSQNCKIYKNKFYNLGTDEDSNNPAVLMAGDINGDNADYHTVEIYYNEFELIYGRAIDGFYGESEIYCNTFHTILNGIADTGMAIEVNGPNNKIYNNTIFDFEQYGIFLNDDPVDGDGTTYVYNNIIASDTYDVNQLIRVEATETYVIDNNHYYDSNGYAAAFHWLGDNDDTFAGWQSRSSQDANGAVGDPLFANANGDDLTLQPTSPCIDAGTIPTGFESIFPLDPRDLVWPPTVLTEDYDEREIGAFGFIPTSKNLFIINIPVETTKDLINEIVKQ